MVVSFMLSGHDAPYAVHMVESVRAVHNCPIVQMTDMATPEVAGVDEVIRHKRDVGLMAFRLRHLARYAHDEMLILDTDVICKAPCPEVWAQPFDVALTIRPKKPEMPYNTGVMFSRGTAFWQECLDVLVRGLKPKHQDWYGDQLAVAQVARNRRFRVLELPCRNYNWAPAEERDTRPAAKFVHYKGLRKKWIKP